MYMRYLFTGFVFLPQLLYRLNPTTTIPAAKSSVSCINRPGRNRRHHYPVRLSLILVYDRERADACPGPDHYYPPGHVQYRVILRQHDEAGGNSTIDEFHPELEEQSITIAE
jgi:hypothetical protein